MTPSRLFSRTNILKGMFLCALAITALTALDLPGVDMAGSVVETPAAYASAGAPQPDQGIVPCGRETDNPKTENDETEKCTICHLALVGNNLVNFLFGIASVMALLGFVITGFLYVFVGANPVAKNQARAAAFNVVRGYVVIFTAWLIVDFVLSAWGFTDPLGGEWSVVCD